MPVRLPLARLRNLPARMALVFATLAAAATVSPGQTFRFVATASTNFSTSAAWSPAGPPTSGAGTALVFDPFLGDLASVTATNDLGNLTLNSLTFNPASGGSTAVTVTGSVGNGLVFASASAGANAFVTQNGGAGVAFAAALPVTLNANTTFGGTGVGFVSVSSAVGGTGGFVIDYAQPGGNVVTGNVTLAGANNFAGGVTLTSGNLTASNASALGTGPLTVNGGTLTNNGVTLTNAVNLTGTLTLLGGSQTAPPTFAGLIADAGSATPQGVRVTASSASTAGFPTTFTAANTFRGDTFLGAPALFKGSLSAGAATSVALSGPAGAFASTASVVVTDGSTFTLDNTSNVNANRLNDAAPVKFLSGALIFNGNAASATTITESVGRLSVGGGGTGTSALAPGQTTIVLNPKAAPAPASGPALVLSASGFDRLNRGTVTFTGPSASSVSSFGVASGANSAQLQLGTVANSPDLAGVGGSGAAGTTTVNVLPYAGGFVSASPVATSGPSDLVTYDEPLPAGTGLGVRPLAFTVPGAGTANVQVGEYYVNGFRGATDDNVKLYNVTGTGSVFNFTVPAGTTINALSVQGTSNLATLAGTLVVKSGLIQDANSVAHSYGAGLTIDANGREAVVIANGTTSFDTAFVNANGFTKGGNAAVTLNNTANNFGAGAAATALLTVNGGQVAFSDGSAFSATAANVFKGITGVQVNTASGTPVAAGLTYTGTTALSVPASVGLVVNSGTARLAATGGAAGTTLLTWNGVVSGDGGLLISPLTAAGSGDVALTNTGNTYKGPTIVGGTSSGTFVGNLVLGAAGNSAADNDKVLGSGGALVLNAGATSGLKLAGDWATGRVVQIITASQIDTAGFSATLNGLLIGSGGFNKAGNGTLTLTQPAQFSGAVTVNLGSLLVNNGTGAAAGSALGSSPVTVNTGGTFGGNGVVSGNSSSVGGLTVNSGGTVAPGTAAGAGTLRVTDDVTVASGGFWAIRLSSAATPAAAKTGSSTLGALPNPASNTFLDLGTASTKLVVTAGAKFKIDGGGQAFDPAQSYSFVVGRAGSVTDGSAAFADVTGQSLFTASNFGTSAFNFTVSSANGLVYLDLSPVPEPAAAFGLAAAAVGVAALRRRRR